MSRLLVERTSELASLNQAITELQQENNGPKVVYITGQVGSGRSSLVQAAMAANPAIARIVLNKPQKLRDFIPVNSPELEKYDGVSNLFKQVATKVEQCQIALSLPDLTTADPFEPRLRAVQAIPPEALHYVIRRLYSLYDISKLSDQAVMFIKTGLEHTLQLNATNLGQLRIFVEQIVQPSLTTEEWAVYLRPEETQAQIVATSLATQGPLLMVIDEYAPLNDEKLLPEVIEKSGQTLWLLVSENKPGWAEKLTCPTEQLELAPLSNEAIADYFTQQQERDLSASELEWLANFTEGQPLLVALVSDLFGRGISAATLESATLRTPKNKLNGLVLYFIEESGLLTEQQRAMLYTLALLRHNRPEFMFDFATKVREADFPFSSEMAQELFSTYPWLQEADETAQEWPTLQPALKEVLRGWLLIEKNRFSRVIQEGIIEPARNATTARLVQRENELINLPPDFGSLRARVNDPIWQEAVLDMSYYRWWLDEAVGWLFALPRTVMALPYNQDFARQILALAETMSRTFYVEGEEILPYLRILLTEPYNLTAPKNIFEEKLKALEKLEEFSSSDRGRWFKQENLGLRQGGKGSGEAELRGILRWLQAQIYEQSAQYDRAASLYESVLATNVKMPELQLVAARAGLCLALRYRLKGAQESALSALNRAVELNPNLTQVYQLLLWQGLRMNRPDVILKAVQGLATAPDSNLKLDLFSAFALLAQGRLPEAQSSARAYAGRNSDGRDFFQKLVQLSGIDPATPGLEDVLAEF